VIGPQQRISREEALRIFTYNGAYALWMEEELGSIEAGKLADLVILSQNPLTCPEDDIREIKAGSFAGDVDRGDQLTAYLPPLWKRESRAGRFLWSLWQALGRGEAGRQKAV
jgi:hypothetical protein